MDADRLSGPPSGHSWMLHGKRIDEELVYLTALRILVRACENLTVRCPARRRRQHVGVRWSGDIWELDPATGTLRRRHAPILPPTDRAGLQQRSIAAFDCRNESDLWMLLIPGVLHPLQGTDREQAARVKVDFGTLQAGEFAPPQSQKGSGIDESAKARINNPCEAFDLVRGEIAGLGLRQSVASRSIKT
jgi:hypothetical protein